MRLTNAVMGRLAALGDDERGAMSFGSIVAMLFLSVLIGFLANVSNAVNQKVEAQNAADAAAYAGALWMARGMNTVTATNHLIGEMQGLVVIHEAIAGPDPLLVNALGEDMGSFLDKLEKADLLSLVPGGSMTPNLPQDLNDAMLVPPLPWEPLSVYSIAGTSLLEVVSLRYAGIPTGFVSAFESALKGKFLETLKSFGSPKGGGGKTKSEGGLPGDYELVKNGLSARAVGGAVLNGFVPVATMVLSGGTVGEGKIQLKEHLDLLYKVQVIAASLGLQELVQALNAVEGYIVAEWAGLTALEIAAAATMPLKTMLIQEMIPNARRFQDDVVKLVPVIAEATALDLARRNGCDVELPPGVARLPVVPERFEYYQPSDVPVLGELASVRVGPINAYQEVEKMYPQLRAARLIPIMRSQIVRASYPYVVYHRAPLVLAMSWMRFSGAAGAFLEGTDYLTLFKAEDLIETGSKPRFAELDVSQETGDAKPESGNEEGKLAPLLVLEGIDDRPELRGGIFEALEQLEVRKWETEWARTSDKADELFAVVAATRRPMAPPFVGEVFRSSANPGPRAMAQALLYNANATSPSPSVFYQARFGWDTLNWDQDRLQYVPEHPFSALLKLAKDVTSGPVKGFAEAAVAVETEVRKTVENPIGLVLPPSPRVKVNWQAKLVPVAGRRLSVAAGQMKSSWAEAVQGVAPAADSGEKGANDFKSINTR